MRAGYIEVKPLARVRQEHALKIGATVTATQHATVFTIAFKAAAE
jgi:hypothetical protein